MSSLSFIYIYHVFIPYLLFSCIIFLFPPFLHFTVLSLFLSTNLFFISDWFSDSVFSILLTLSHLVFLPSLCSLFRSLFFSIPLSFLSCCLSKDRKYFTLSLCSSNSALGLLWVWWEMAISYMHVVLFSSDSSTNFVQACVIRTSLNVIKIFWHTSNPVSTFVTTAIQFILDKVLILWNLNWRNNYI